VERILSTENMEHMMPHKYAQPSLSRPSTWLKPAYGAALAAALFAGACASKPPPPTEPVVSDKVQQITATVEAVDPATRMVRLRGPEGTTEIVLGPEVRNFSQIRVGDVVKATYYTGVAAQIRKHGDPAPPPTNEVAVARAKPGEMPAAGMAQNISTTVTIESVDVSFNTVSFQLPAGDKRVVAVQTPEGREFIRTLKKGDQVDLTYTEAVAVEVVPGR
jgi:hypothetical protein